MSLEIKDDNKIPDVINELKQIRGSHVLVGWFGEMAKIAAVHEFGARVPVSQKMRGLFAALGFPLKKDTTHFVIPERAPLRSTAESKAAHDKLEAVMTKSLADVWAGKRTAKQHIAAIGETVVAAIRNTITDGLPPDNHPVTVILKKSAKPLVNKGQLIRSLTWQKEK